MYPTPKTTARNSAPNRLYKRVTKQLITPDKLLFYIGLAYIGFSAAEASTFDFLSANGAHPLSGLISIPQARFLAPQSGPVVSAGNLSGNAVRNADLAVSIQSDYSNIFTGGSRDGEFVLLDGETARTTVAIVSRVGACFQLAADFTQVAHRAGSLDSTIEKWHEFFQLPDAQRNQTETDRLSIIYESGDASLTLDNQTRSLGDTVLQFAYQSDCGVGGTTLPGAIWFTGVSLPTGNLENLSGSDEMAAFFGMQSHSLAIGQQLTTSTRLGVLLPQDIEDLPETSSFIAFGNIGLQWHPHWLAQLNTRLMLQLDLHSPLFKSTLRELGNYTAQLAIGGKWNPSKFHELSAAFIEDVAIDTAPDLVFHLQYRFAF